LEEEIAYQGATINILKDNFACIKEKLKNNEALYGESKLSILQLEKEKRTSHKDYMETIEKLQSDTNKTVLQLEKESRSNYENSMDTIRKLKTDLGKVNEGTLNRDNQINDLKKQQKKLEDQVESLQRKSKSYEDALFHNQEKISLFEQMNGELKSKLTLQENLLKENIDLKNSVLKIREDFSKMEAQHDKIDTQEKEIHSQHIVITKLNANIEALNEVIKTKNEDIVNSNEKCQQKENEIEILKKKNEEEVEYLKNTISSERELQKHQKLEMEKISFQLEKSVIRERCREDICRQLNEDSDNKDNQMVPFHKLSVSTSSDVKGLRQELVYKEYEIETFLMEMQNLKNEKRDQEVQYLRDFEEYQTQIDFLNDKVEELARKNISFQGKVEKLASLLIQQQHDISQEKAENMDLKNIVSSLEDEVKVQKLSLDNVIEKNDKSIQTIKENMDAENQIELRKDTETQTAHIPENEAASEKMNEDLRAQIKSLRRDLADAVEEKFFFQNKFETLKNEVNTKFEFTEGMVELKEILNGKEKQEELLNTQVKELSVDKIKFEKELLELKETLKGKEQNLLEKINNQRELLNKINDEQHEKLKFKDELVKLKDSLQEKEKKEQDLKFQIKKILEQQADEKDNDKNEDKHNTSPKNSLEMIDMLGCISFNKSDQLKIKSTKENSLDIPEIIKKHRSRKSIDRLERISLSYNKTGMSENETNNAQQTYALRNRNKKFLEKMSIAHIRNERKKTDTASDEKSNLFLDRVRKNRSRKSLERI